MSCFTLGFLEQLIVWVIVITAVVMIIQLLIPLVAGPLGAFSQVIRIALWAVVAIMIVYFIFDLLSCAVGGPPFHHFVR